MQEISITAQLILLIILENIDEQEVDNDGAESRYFRDIVMGPVDVHGESYH